MSWETFATLVCVALANWTIVETINHGSLFRWTKPILRCVFCWSKYPALLLVAMLWITNRLEWLEAIVVWFGSVGLSHLISDYLNVFIRSPNRTHEDL